MKTIFALLLISFISLPFVSFAQLDVFVKYTEDGSITPDINYYGSKKISEKVSLTYFGLIEKTWGEALVGVSYTPVKYLSIGTMVGIEHGSDKPRYFGSVWTGKGNTSLLLMAEKGKGSDNYWYRANLYQKLSDEFTLGVTAWRFNGVGPNLRYTVKKSVTVWAMPAYDVEFKQTKVMLGVNIPM